MSTMKNTLEKANGSSAHIIVSSGMLVAVIGLVYWVGTMSQQLADLNKDALRRSGSNEISIEADKRLTLVENSLHMVETQVDGIDGRQRVVMDKLDKLIAAEEVARAKAGK